jgi:hypothetical protein
LEIAGGNRRSAHPVSILNIPAGANVAQMSAGVHSIAIDDSLFV